MDNAHIPGGYFKVPTTLGIETVQATRINGTGLGIRSAKVAELADYLVGRPLNMDEELPKLIETTQPMSQLFDEEEARRLRDIRKP